jgi:hypothetical protein
MSATTRALSSLSAEQISFAHEKSKPDMPPVTCVRSAAADSQKCCQSVMYRIGESEALTV